MVIREDFAIFKSLERLEHAQSLLDGTLILRSHFYYRIHVDRSEFTITNIKGRFSLVGDALLFCCHKIRPNDKQYLVKIDRSLELFQHISRMMSTALIHPRSYFGEVTYEDMNLENLGNFDVKQIKFYNDFYESPSSEEIVNNFGIECAYYKDKSGFSHENEVRMCFLICPERLSEINDPNIEIKFMKRYMDQETINWIENPIDYISWKKDRTINQNWDNFWFEVHLKVDKDYFALDSQH